MSDRPNSNNDQLYQEASTKRKVAHPNFFYSSDLALWEQLYELILAPKYRKNTRNFSQLITGSSLNTDNDIFKGKTPIYMIPRVRAGPSFKDVPLKGIPDNSVIQYCPISKGYGMQNVSSFTMGPIVSEGLCLVNAAFSKSICIMHINGGGTVDLKRKNFWKPSKNPERNIEFMDKNNIVVNGEIFETFAWLKNNENLWLDEWEKWRKSVALCSMGDFHWTRIRPGEYSPTVAYKMGDTYLDFVNWKKECYIKPSYELLPKTDVFIFLKDVWETKNIPIGLVHPKSTKGYAEEPITEEFLLDMFNSETVMCCQPYVVAACLMDLKI